VTLDQAALDALDADIEAQTAALPPTPADDDVAWYAAFLARVDIRLAREAAEDRAPRSQGADRGRGARRGSV
jgi:hypothetical protein